MCTVSYIPKGKGEFILSSNRDERKDRATVPPLQYESVGGCLLYPKDTEAEGTWIATSDKSRACCLLNGAFVPHKPSEQYTYSRGKLVLDILQAKSLQHFITGVNLEKVEPFTLIIAEYGSSKTQELTQLIWDGKSKHRQLLDPKRPYLWASATLYNAEAKRKKIEEFKHWLSSTSDTSKIVDFHKTQVIELQDLHNLVKQDKRLRTTSITILEVDQWSTTMEYRDLLNQEKVYKKLKPIVYEKI